MKLNTWLEEKLIKLGDEERKLGFDFRNSGTVQGFVENYDVESGTIYLKAVDGSDNFAIISVEDVIDIYSCVDQTKPVDTSDPAVN